jgi:tartronate-semialdehyde synthase
VETSGQDESNGSGGPCAEREGVTVTFGVPGAAINPIYAAMRPRNTIQHFLALHVEGASHMAEGYTRARAIGTSGPAGTDMITGCYSAWADSIPILCITGQAPRARLYKEDLQAVDIESIAKLLGKSPHRVGGHRADADRPGL